MKAPSVSPRFAVGQAVTVLHLDKTGHIRTPRYVRGKRGIVAQFCGVFLNPEDLSVGRTDGPAVPVYRVGFEQRHLWPEYSGPAGDMLYLEIYEHWLAAAEVR